ncbi:transcription activator effector binding [Methylocella silvestris BL2]|uniref:Transcription activator effector binding n=1 Tax=Methylocella silvestris (strain DSM 15510 / CIP 108128 / LMG 27833 / NCIMB 13906 / BL2) TaxID=395965 RepID=B8EM15_METSB|nr:GyrI-like domain-containing protein [Methylocella silvestris]ACK50796.1 transcription activator effector binding [Methylocella silvestris BL2]
MRFGDFAELTLAFSGRAARAAAALAFLALFAAPAAAEAPTTTPPATEAAPPATPDASPAAPESAAPDATVPEPDQKAAPGAPGVPGDATAETVEVTAKPVALLVGDAEWAEGFKSILAALDKAQEAVKTAGLKQAGPPFAVFLSTDDTSFHFEAMVPIEAKPDGKTELTGGVKIGDSPAGKAIKFLHRGAYDDIDSTYDLITAYLDEKGLDSKNLFIEEYLTPTRESDDAGLEADIYVFLK